VPVDRSGGVHGLVLQLVLNVDLELRVRALWITARQCHGLGENESGLTAAMSGPGKVPPARTALRETPSGEMTAFEMGSVAEGPSTAGAGGGGGGTETATVAAVRKNRKVGRREKMRIASQRAWGRGKQRVQGEASHGRGGRGVDNAVVHVPILYMPRSCEAVRRFLWRFHNTVRSSVHIDDALAEDQILLSRVGSSFFGVLKRGRVHNEDAAQNCVLYVALPGRVVERGPEKARLSYGVEVED
jgi:hypothetical protein